MSKYSHLSREEIEKRLEVAEGVCSCLEKHNHQVDPGLWRKTVSFLRKWSSLKESTKPVFEST